MRLLFAILFPPHAVLMTGRFFGAILNVLLTMWFYVPGMLHAPWCVHEDNKRRGYGSPGTGNVIIHLKG